MEGKYVIRECISSNCPGIEINGENIACYLYGNKTGFDTAGYFDKQEFDKANRYAFKTIEGAQKAIEIHKRNCVVSCMEEIEYSQNHTKQEVNDWLDEKIKETNWEESDFSFKIITVDEMINELKECNRVR